MYVEFKKTRKIEGIDCVIDYYVVSKIDKLTNERIYGISIEMFDSNNDTLLEEDSIPNLTCSLKQIRELLLVLYNNTVTPCELVYIVDDYMSTNDNFNFDVDEEMTIITA